MCHVLLLTTGTPSFVQGMSAYTATSGTLSAACGRISFTFGLKVSGAPCHASAEGSCLLTAAGNAHLGCALALLHLSASKLSHLSLHTLCRAPA